MLRLSRVSVVIALVALGLLSEIAQAFQLPDEEADARIASTELTIAETSKLGELLSGAKILPCNWFGYALTCSRLKISKTRLDKLDVELSKIDPSEYGYPYRFPFRGKHEEAGGDIRDADLYIVGDRPPYIPYLAYGGKIDGHWMKAYDKASDYEGGTHGHLMAPKLKGKGRPLTISPARDFDALVHAKSEGYYFNENWFNGFAEASSVKAGGQAVEFWQDFADYTGNYDFAQCKNVCFGAFVFESSARDFRSIELCSLEVISGVAGAPENCVTAVYQHKGKTFLRAMVVIVGPGLGADGGSTDIVCKSKIGSGANIQKAGAVFKSVFEKLNDTSTKYFVQFEEEDDDGFEMIAENRFTKSYFFDGYENSTIRVSGSVSDDTIEFEVITSFYLYEREVSDPSKYHGLTVAQTKSAIQKLASLLPKAFGCKIVAP